MKIRKGASEDFDTVKAVMNTWWGGREVSHLQHELFFKYFTDTVFIVESAEEELLGFLNGLYSQVDRNSAYVHFVGVSPKVRGQGIGRQLYQRFFEQCLSVGRNRIFACTSKGNLDSICFHEKMGFFVRPDSREKVQFELTL